MRNQNQFALPHNAVWQALSPYRTPLFPKRIAEPVLFLLLRHIQFVFCNIGAGNAVLRIDGAAIQLLMRRFHKEKSVADSALTGVMPGGKSGKHIGDIKIEHSVKHHASAEDAAAFDFYDYGSDFYGRVQGEIVEGFRMVALLYFFDYFGVAEHLPRELRVYRFP